MEKHEGPAVMLLSIEDTEHLAVKYIRVDGQRTWIANVS